MAQERRSPRAPSDHSENGPSSRSSGRRRHSRSFSASSGVLYAVAVIGVSILLACVCWIAANDVLALNKPEKEVTITVDKEDSFNQVADRLKKRGSSSIRACSSCSPLSPEARPRSPRGPIP